MKTKKVYLVLSTKSGSVNGCFATKKDANKYIGESQNFVIKKCEVQSYESKKESVITPLGITVNISKQLDNLLTQDLPLSMKYKCLSDISKEIDDRLKEIDNSIGKSTLDRYNFPHTHKKIWDYWSSVLMENNVVFEGGFRSGRTHFYEDWSKQLNEYLRSKGFKNDEPFGMAPIEDVEFELERTENGIMEKYFIVDKKGERTPIAPPLGFNHDFHKQAIEAEKELDKVCKPKKECEHFRRKIDNYYVHAYSGSPSITNIICLDCGLDLTLDKMQKQKDRQIEIGKEIEKLRIEARTIKNQLKDSN